MHGPVEEQGAGLGRTYNEATRRCRHNKRGNMFGSKHRTSVSLDLSIDWLMQHMESVGSKPSQCSPNAGTINKKSDMATDEPLFSAPCGIPSYAWEPSGKLCLTRNEWWRRHIPR